MSVELVAVYAGLTLLAGLLIAEKGRDWRLRLVAIIVAPLLAFALWQAAQPPQGWPTSSRTPKAAVLLWGAIREPQSGDPGRIFIWLDVGAAEPRAFSLPYTRRLHKQLQAAMNATRHGHTVTVASQPHPQAGRQNGQHSPGIHFYPHPPAQLPAKDTH